MSPQSSGSKRKLSTKYWLTFNRLNGVISQKIRPFQRICEPYFLMIPPVALCSVASLRFYIVGIAVKYGRGQPITVAARSKA
jgi:hypothetical protein